MNTRGPKIEPCGTPVKTSCTLDKHLTEFTTADLLKYAERNM